MESLFTLNERLNEHKKIIIYGSGVAARCIFMKLFQLNIKVDCFADCNPENCGKKLFNTPVFHINDLIDSNKDAAVIIGGRYISDIFPELEKLGFEHIFFDYTNELGFIYLERDDN